MATAPTASGRGTELIRPLSYLVAALLVIIGMLLLLSLMREPSTAAERTTGEPRFEVMTVIDGPGAGDRPRFERPLGVAISSEGVVYVADTGNDRICAFDLDGSFIRTWGTIGVTKPVPGSRATWSPGNLNGPAGVDVGPDGLVYVADFNNDQVSVFDERGGFVRAFPDPTEVTGRGGSGKGGRGIAVTDVAVGHNAVWATDSFQVFEFSTGGDVIRQLGRPGSGTTDFDRPNGIAVRPDGGFVISDSNHARVVAFDDSGTLEWETRAWQPNAVGSEDRFALPRGIAVTNDGRTVVADAIGQQLVFLDPRGKLITALGRRGVRPGEFNFPVDVATMEDVVVVADKENDRVQVLLVTGDAATPSDVR